MSGRIKNVLGYTWASPLTIVGLLYALTFSLVGWYKWHSAVDDALVWVTNESESPVWLRKMWSAWAGQTIGNVVVICELHAKDSVVLNHEMAHVRQCMMLGIFQPLFYALSYVAIKLGCSNAHPYYDNPFEIDARRKVGQTVDVIGAMKKLKAVKDKK